jgi:predicted nucleotide-binding protein
MKELRFRDTHVPASRLGKIRDYLGLTNSASLGDAWDHKVWSYELWYADGPTKCATFDEVKKTIKERGETTTHLTYFESRTGRKIRFDTTKPGEIILAVENRRLTDAMLKRVAEIMSLSEFPRRVFITHGHGATWREVADFIEKECNPKLPTLELASRANLGRTVIEKLDQEAAHCSYAVVVMTGDDITEDGETRARENVVHEIGFFQGRYGRSRVCLLHEQGVNIPSNLGGVVYCSFPKGKTSAAFIELQRDLAAAFPADK